MMESVLAAILVECGCCRHLVAETRDAAGHPAVQSARAAPCQVVQLRTSVVLQLRNPEVAQPCSGFEPSL